MQIKNGVDILNIERFAKAFDKHGDVFAKKILTPDELAHCMGVVEKMAGRFAAKEAVLKALGTGFWQNGITLRDVSVLPDRWGAPSVVLSGQALVIYEELGGSSISVSISHDSGFVIASCVILITA